MQERPFTEVQPRGSLQPEGPLRGLKGMCHSKPREGTAKARDPLGCRAVRGQASTIARGRFLSLLWGVLIRATVVFVLLRSVLPAPVLSKSPARAV